MTFLEPQHTGRRSHMTASTATAVSLHSDYFGQTGSHSGSTALTSPSLETPHKSNASFHSLQDIAEAVEANPLGLGPPPGTVSVYSHDSLQQPDYYPDASQQYHPQEHAAPQQQGYAEPEAYYSASSNSHHDPGITHDAGIYANLSAYEHINHDDVDPMYADDHPSAEDLHRAPSVKSRASQYEASLSGRAGLYDGLGIRLGAPPRSPSVMSGGSGASGRRSPLRFPSNPDRPGSPMRLPPSPGIGGPSRGASPQRLPPSPQHLSLPSSGAPSPSKPSSDLRAPPSPSSARGKRAPSPLGMNSIVPEPEPELLPPALPTTPATPPSRKRVPIPSSLPATGLSRGAGSTKRMVDQWESKPVTPQQTGRPLPVPVPATAPPLSHPRHSQEPQSPTKSLSQKYLDRKPLPIPTATPIPASANMPWPPPAAARSPGHLNHHSHASPLSRRTTPRTSPIKALSPSSWSPFARRQAEHSGEVDTPTKSPLKSPTLSESLKRSPFKEIKNVFSGLRKGKAKDREEPTGWGTAMVGVNGDKPHQFINQDDGWFATPLRNKSNATPGPAVLDRMGDAEMALSAVNEESDTIRSTAALYLAPVPDSSQWGSWMTAWATLSNQTLAVTYVPVFQSSPRRGTIYASIAPPGRTSRPDDDLSMRECVEVRSLRRDEVRGRGIPSLPENAGSEVLELVFSHGAKRYIAVDGVAGRLGWVSAIWDVLLACKKDGARLDLPPPSPSLKSLHSFGPGYDGSLRHFRSDWSEPAQKVDGTWVASSNSAYSSAHTTSGSGNCSSPREAPRGLFATNQSPRMASQATGESVYAPQPLSPHVTGPHTAAALERAAEEDDLPPPPPPKSRRGTMIEERIRAFHPQAEERTPHEQRGEQSGAREIGQTEMDEMEIKPTPPLKLRSQHRLNSTATLQTQETAATLGSPASAYSPRARARVPTSASTPTTSTHTTTTSHTQPSHSLSFATGSSGSTPLREASLRMFDASEPRRSAKMEDRIRAWQPRAEETPPPLSRVGSKGSSRISASSELSFDPSDLNPSRSASQVRGRRSELPVDLTRVDAGLARITGLPAVKEYSPGSGMPGSGSGMRGMRKRVPKYGYGEEVEGAANEPQAGSCSLPKPGPSIGEAADDKPELATQPVELAAQLFSEKVQPIEEPTAIQPEKPAVTVKTPPAAAEASEAPAPPSRTPQPKTCVEPNSMASPKATPGRLNPRMLAAAAVFEPSIVQRHSPQPTGVPARSPSIKAPVARQTTSVQYLESMFPPSEVSSAPAKSGPAATPAGKSVAERLESLQKTDERAEKVRRLNNVGRADKLEKMDTGTWSALSDASKTTAGWSSVRERIEAISRAAETATARTPGKLSSPAATGTRALSPAAAGSGGRRRLNDSPAVPRPRGRDMTQPSATPIKASPAMSRVMSPVSTTPTTQPLRLNSNKRLPLSPEGTLSENPSIAQTSLPKLAPSNSMRDLGTRSPASTRGMIEPSPSRTGASTTPLSIKRVPPPQASPKHVPVPQNPTVIPPAPLSPPRRQLFVANPSPDSPDVSPEPRALATFPDTSAPEEGSNSAPDLDAGTPRAARGTVTAAPTDLTTPQESITGVLAGYDTPDAGTATPGPTRGPTPGPSMRGPTPGPSMVGPSPSMRGTPAASVRNLPPDAARLTPTATGGTRLTRSLTGSGEPPNDLGRQIADVQVGVHALTNTMGDVAALLNEREEREDELCLDQRLDALNDGLVGIHSAVATLPLDLSQRLTALGTDLKTVQMVLYESSAQIADLSAKQDEFNEAAEKERKKDGEKELPPPPVEAAEPALPEINAKLDALAALIQEVLARQDAAAAEIAAAAAKEAPKEHEDRDQPKVLANVATDVPKEPKEAKEDEPTEKADAPASPAPAADAGTAEQIAEIQAAVAKLGEERAVQTAQTADIAKYLSDLNGWLEKFVSTSGSELTGMNSRLDGILKSSEDGEATGAIADLQRKLDESPATGGGVQAERLDALVQLMGEERERATQQTSVVEHVVQLIDKQRADNEMLLRAVATDLTSEIRGERVRFIEAMREATTMNMQIHVDEFKKALTNEVSQSMRDLGHLREQKKALEHRIADLFALIAKHADEGKMPAYSFPTSPPATVTPPMAPPSPGPRALPMPPQ